MTAPSQQCPRCQGKGEHMYESELATCSYCGGTGRLAAPAQTPTEAARETAQILQKRLMVQDDVGWMEIARLIDAHTNLPALIVVAMVAQGVVSQWDRYTLVGFRSALNELCNALAALPKPTKPTKP
jgi:hypothetical protein